jgi:hypothetical protein
VDSLVVVAGSPSQVEQHIQRSISSVNIDEENARLEKALGIDSDSIKKQVNEEAKSKQLEKMGLPKEAPTPMSGVAASTAGIPNLVEQAAKGAVGGVVDFAQTVTNGVITAADWMENTAAKLGVGSGDLINEESKVDWSKAAPVNSGEFKNVGRAVRAITKYVAPLATPIGEGMLARGVFSAATNFLGFDPHQERLSNLVQEYPALRNPVSAYLAADPKDTDFEGRLKNTLEGLGIMGAAEAALMGGLKITKMFKEGKAVNAATEAAPLAAKIPENGVPAKAAVQQVVDTPAQKAELELFDKQWAEVYPKEGAQAPVMTSSFGTAQSVSDLGKASKLNPTVFNSSDDVLKYITQYAKDNKDNLNKFRTNKITFEQTKKDAAILLGDSEGVGKIINPATGAPFNAEELVAAKMVAVSSGESLAEHALNVVKDPSNKVAQSAFEDAKQAHNMVMGALKSGSSETARALNAGKIAPNPIGMARSKMVDQSVELAGGSESLVEQAKKIRAIYDIPEGDFGTRMGEVQKLTKFHKFDEALSFYVVNNLLTMKSFGSAFIGNAANNVIGTMDRAFQAGIGKVFRIQDAPTISAVTQEIHGQMGALMEGMTAAGESLMTGHAAGPANVMKADFPTINPISSARLGISDSSNVGARAIGKLADGVGLALSVPSRLIAPADSFWATVAYRGRVRSMAYEQAMSNGLKGEELQTFMKSVTSSPPEEIHQAAVAYAREQVYAKPLEGIAAGIDNGLRNSIPLGRAIIPMFRTTANEIEYIAVHSPLALMSPNVRAAISRGGAEGSLAVAKIATGMTGLGVMTYLAATGSITGEVPQNKDTAKALQEEHTGRQPNSLHVGDTYISLDKFGVLAAPMRLGAMIADIKNFVSEGEYQHLIVSAGSALADAFTPETFVSGLSQLMKVAATASNPNASSQDVAEMNNTLVQFTTRFQPLGGIQNDIAKVMDPAKPYTGVYKTGHGALDNFMNSVATLYKSRTPFLSKDVPADRNLFGDAILNPVGFGPDLISPLAMRQGEGSDVADQLRVMANYTEHLRAVEPDMAPLDIKMPSRNIPNIHDQMPFELTPKEYEEYVIASAGRDPKTGENLHGPNLKESLAKVVLGDGFKAAFDKYKGNNIIATKALNASVKDVITGYRKMGIGYMLNNFNIKERMRDEAGARTKLLERQK